MSIIIIIIMDKTWFKRSQSQFHSQIPLSMLIRRAWKLLYTHACTFDNLLHCWFARDVMAAILVPDNKTSVIRFSCLYLQHGRSVFALEISRDFKRRQRLSFVDRMVLRKMTWFTFIAWNKFSNWKTWIVSFYRTLT